MENKPLKRKQLKNGNLQQTHHVPALKKGAPLASALGSCVSLSDPSNSGEFILFSKCCKRYTQSFPRNTQEVFLMVSSFRGASLLRLWQVLRGSVPPGTLASCGAQPLAVAPRLWPEARGGEPGRHRGSGLQASSALHCVTSTQLPVVRRPPGSGAPGGRGQRAGPGLELAG